MDNERNIYEDNWQSFSMDAAPNPREGLPARDRAKAVGYDVLNGIGNVDKWRREHPTQFRLVVMAGFTALPFAVSGVQHAFAQDMPTCDTVSQCDVNNQIYAGACINPDNGSYGQYCTDGSASTLPTPTLPPAVDSCADLGFQARVITEGCLTQSDVVATCQYPPEAPIAHHFKVFGGEGELPGTVNVALYSSTAEQAVTNPVTGAIVNIARCDVVGAQPLWANADEVVATPLPTPEVNHTFPSGLPMNRIHAPEPAPTLGETFRDLGTKAVLVAGGLGLSVVAALGFRSVRRRDEALRAETERKNEIRRREASRARNRRNHREEDGAGDDTTDTQTPSRSEAINQGGESLIIRPGHRSWHSLFRLRYRDGREEMVDVSYSKRHTQPGNHNSGPRRAQREIDKLYEDNNFVAHTHDAHGLTGQQIKDIKVDRRINL